MLIDLMIWYSKSSTPCVQDIVYRFTLYRVSKIQFKDVHNTGCPKYSSRMYTVQGVLNIVQGCKLYRVYKIQLKNENCAGCPKYSYERQPFVQCKQTHLTEIVNLIVVQYNYLLCINIKCTCSNVGFLLYSFLVIIV